MIVKYMKRGRKAGRREEEWKAGGMDGGGEEGGREERHGG